MLWACALPGTVAVIAALTLPDLLSEGGEIAAPARATGSARETAASAAAPVATQPLLDPLPDALPVQGRRVLRVPLAAEPFDSADAIAGETAEPELVDSPQMEVVGALAMAPAAREIALAAPVEVDVSPALAPDPASEAAPEPAAPPPRAFGGAKGSFAALVPTSPVAAEAGLAPDTALIAAPSAPARARDAAPGRRPALTAEAAPAAPPVATPAVVAPAPSRPVAEPTARAAAPVPRAVVQAAPAASAPAIRPSAAQAPVPVPERAAMRAVPAVSAPASAPARAIAPTPVRAAAPAPARAAAAPTAPALQVAAARAAPATRAPVAAPAPIPGRAPAAALVPLPPVKSPAAPAAGSAQGRPDAVALDIRSQLTTRIDGKNAGKVDFQQTTTGLAVRLGSIVELLGDRYDAAQIARIRASAAGDVYLPLSQLQAQGIPISYDPVYDEFNVGTLDTRPKAARKVHMDQISTPERGLGSTGMDQVRRP